MRQHRGSRRCKQRQGERLLVATRSASPPVKRLSLHWLAAWQWTCENLAFYPHLTAYPTTCFGGISRFGAVMDLTYSSLCLDINSKAISKRCDLVSKRSQPDLQLSSAVPVPPQASIA